MAKGGGGGGKGGGGGAPSGGGGGGKGGGGGAPSGGGGAKSAPTPAPAPPPAAPPVSVPKGDTGGKKEAKSSSQNAPQAVAYAKSYQQQKQQKTTSPVAPQKKGGATAQVSSDIKDKKQDRVKTLTEKAKTLISGATSAGIADPGKFKDILSKLKGLDKDKLVQNLRTKKQKAVQKAGATSPAPGDNDTDKNTTIIQGYSQDELDALLGDLRGEYDSKISDLMDQLKQKKEQEPETEEQNKPPGSTSEFDDWLKDFGEEQGKGDFDPDLFRNLLGELESSKYRQKQWNERSARAAYAY